MRGLLHDLYGGSGWQELGVTVFSPELKRPEPFAAGYCLGLNCLIYGMRYFCLRIAGGFKPLVLLPAIFFLCVCLAGCQTEIHRGLNEDQANEMLATLLKRGIRAEKESAGKSGYTILVDSKQIVRALQILKDKNLPRENFATMGNVFSGQGMISTPVEEQSRLAYAISQELAATLSRIDGVLTARVHVVLGSVDQATDTRTQPSAAVFLRYLPESQVVNMAPKIKELTANSVPELSFDRVSVMFVPVRETVGVPMSDPPALFGLMPVVPEDGFPYLTVGIFLMTAAVIIAIIVWLLIFYFKPYNGAGRHDSPPPQPREE